MSSLPPRMPQAEKMVHQSQMCAEFSLISPKKNNAVNVEKPAPEIQLKKTERTKPQATFKLAEFRTLRSNRSGFG